MIFNEKNLRNTEDKLAFNALGVGTSHLSFTSEKNFEDIFRKFLEIPNEENTILEKSNTDSSESAESEDGYELI